MKMNKHNNITVNLIKAFFVLILFAFTTVQAQYSYVDSLAQVANQAYKSKNYEKAIDAYEKVLNEGYESSQLYYNLGNAYYKYGLLGKAILNYERALRLNPQNEDAIYNLKIANAHAIDKINAVPKFFLAEWWDYLLELFPINTIAIITAGLFVLLLFFIWLFFYGKTANGKKLGFTLGSVTFAFLLFFAFLYFGKAKQVSTEKYGIILAKEITVKVSPDENAKAAFILHEGTKFLLEDKVGNWGNIKLADGKEGWAPLSSFELIEK
jgi:tetratricopeptide (TPR) repeat protein